MNQHPFDDAELRSDAEVGFLLRACEESLPTGWHGLRLRRKTRRVGKIVVVDWVADAYSEIGNATKVATSATSAGALRHLYNMLR